MRKKYIFRRYLLFAVALFVNAMGVAYITKAGLGTSPITSVTYVASMFTPLTIGQWTILFNLLLVALELPLMTRRQFRDDRLMYLLQIPVTFFFGTCIDLSMNLLFWLTPVSYFSMFGSLLIGCMILALGIALEVKADAAMMAGEYFVRVLSRRMQRDFGYVKLGFDITLVVLACALSLCFLSGIYGVREGTIVAAVAVGPIVHFVTPAYRVFDGWIGALAPASAPVAGGAGQAASARPRVITIAREYGSGGHLLGEMLAKELGIKLYDKDFITLAAQRSGIDEPYIRANEQQIPSFWLKCIAASGGELSRERSLSPDDVLYVAESRIVRELAAAGPCIIVGRLADFILQNEPGVIRVFCHADRAHECARCVNEYGIPADRAAAEVARINRQRITHYEYYTGNRWGDPAHYHLAIDTGRVPIALACRMVAELYRGMPES